MRGLRGILFLFCNEFNILRDFKNAPFYIFCLFHMIELRMFLYHFLSSCEMDHDLP